MLEPEVSQSVAERGDSGKRAVEGVLTASTQEPLIEEGNCPFNFRPQLFHLHKDHELFEEGDVHRHLYLQDLYTSEDRDKPALCVSEFACHISGCSAVHSTLEEYEHHYNSLHRHVCCSCRRSLPSARLLDIHIQEWHDSLFTILAQRQDMYKCLVEGCEHKFRTSTHRKEHLIRIHKYPPDFRFDKTRKGKETLSLPLKPTVSKKPEAKQQHQKDAMEVVDVCESEGVCELVCDLVPEQSETQEESMDMQLCDNSGVKTTTPEEDAHLSATVHVTSAGAEPQKPRYLYRVPATVCFGHGSVRGFRGRRGRRK